MSFSQRAGLSFLPLLSRIVLGTAFLFSGWYHCFNTVSFSDAELSRIEAFQASTSTAATVIPVVWQAGTDADLSDDPETPPAAAPSAAPSAGPNDRPAVYRLAMDLSDWGVTSGVVPLAWGIVVFEMIAGALVLLGLFTRLWGFLLACLLGAAFAFTSVKANDMFEMNPFAWRGQPAHFYEMYFQAAGFVLAIGLALTGSGVLALDNLVFGRREKAAPPKAAAS